MMIGNKKAIFYRNTVRNSVARLGQSSCPIWQPKRVARLGGKSGPIWQHSYSGSQSGNTGQGTTHLPHNSSLQGDDQSHRRDLLPGVEEGHRRLPGEDGERLRPGPDEERHPAAQDLPRARERPPGGSGGGLPGRTAVGAQSPMSSDHL